MSKNRRKYTLNKSIKVNETLISEVIIDSHVDKHKDHVTDELIISLVELLDGRTYSPAKVQDGFSYFVSRILYTEKVYRLVWLQKKDQFYIGVVTAFNEKGAKHDIP
ncbi:MAG: hypothetical protein KAG61_07920 [Bacteriovoracaceae bacterium]|nr:hypothetical protein [Bacteriovoracaceae bacterium]